MPHFVIIASDLPTYIEINIDEWYKKRDELVDKSTAHHFSNDIKVKEQGLLAQKKLIEMRSKLLHDDPTINTGSYYEKLPKLLESGLYDCLASMPKPAVHHIHLTAACPIDFLVQKITYYDFVYYNEKE